MSSDRPSDVRSTRPDREPGLAPLLRTRGAPLLEAVEQHAPGARDHAEATAAYAFVAAVAAGFGRDRCEVTREAARLHEIGHAYVPAAVLAKPAAERDEAEAAAFEAHHEAGYRLARGAGVPEHACGWLLRVRERYDGAGPEALAGEAIPIESRIIRAACLCATVLATANSARQDSAAGAIESLRAQAGAELDPRIAAGLAASLGRASGEPG